MVYPLFPRDPRLVGLRHVSGRKRHKALAREEVDELSSVLLTYDTVPVEAVGILQGVATPNFFAVDSLHGAVLHPAEDFLVR